MALLVFFPDKIALRANQFFAKNRDFRLDFLHQKFQGFEGSPAVRRRHEHEQTDFARRYQPQAMVDMEAGEFIFFESRFADLMKNTFGHFGVGRILDACHHATFLLVGPNLPQKHGVGTNGGFGLMFSQRISHELWADRAFDEYFLHFQL